MLFRIILFLVATLYINKSSAQVELVLQKGHGAALQDVAYSDNGKYLFTNSWDNEIVVWEMASGLQIQRLPATQIKSELIELIPNTTLLITADDHKEIVIWDWAKNKIVQRQSLSSQYTIEDVSWRNGANEYAVAFGSILSGASEIAIFDFETHEPGKRFVFEEELVQNIEFSPDGKMLAYGTKGSMSALFDSVPRTLGILDLLKGKTIYTFPLRFDVGEISFHPSGEIIACNESKVYGQKHKNPAIRFWDLKKGKEIEKWNFPQSTVSGVDFSKDGRKVVFSYYEKYKEKKGDKKGRGVVEVRELKGYNQLNLFETHANNIVVFRPDSRRVLAVNEYYKLIEEYDLMSDSKIQDLSNKLRPTNRLSISPNSKYLASSSQSAFDQTIKIWNLATGRVDHWLQSHDKYPSDIQFSPNGDYLASCSKDKICVWDTKTWSLVSKWDSVNNQTICWYNDQLFMVGTKNGSLLWVSNPDKKIVHSQLTSAPISEIVVKDELVGILSDKTAYLIDLKEEDLKEYDIGGVGNSLIFYRDSFLLTDRTYGIGIANLNSGEISEYKQSIGQGRTLIKHPTDDVLISGTGNSLMQIGELHVWDSDKGEVIETLKHHDQGVQALVFDNYGRLYSASRDGTIGVWDWESRQYIATMVANETEFISFNEKGFYTTSEEGHRFISFKIDEKMYPTEIFDLTFNRPDKIIETLRPTELELIALYQRALDKRVKNADLAISEFNLNQLPKLQLLNVNDIITETVSNNTSLKVEVQSVGSSDLILEVRNNGVLQESIKISSADFGTKRSLIQTLNIPLIFGTNSISIESVSETGIRSLPQTISIQNTGAKNESTTYLLCFSVAEYQDSAMNLRYAVKDGRDFSATITKIVSAKGSKNQEVVVDTFFNKSVTSQQFAAVLDKYSKLQPQDVLIVYLSGHGLLDKEGAFYFSTYDVDFESPQEKGIAFEVIDELLRSCPAMKKLLLMDACHSGQVDKDASDLPLSHINSNSMGVESGVQLVNSFSKGGKAKSRKNVDLTNSFTLMEQLFANINSGTGAHVISAASGDSYAFESPKWNNGVFTYVLIKGIVEMEADLNKDDQISISELKAYVKIEVPKETKGKQRPTTRQGNLKYDWIIR